MAQKFDDFMCKLLDSKLFYIVTIIIGGLICGFLNFYSVDCTPATENDYKPLLEVEESIISDFDSVYSFDNTYVNITEKNIIISIDNDECALKSYFNKEKEHLYTEKFDKADFSYTTNIIISIITGVLGGFLTIVFLFLLCVLILLLLELIEKILDKKQKANNQGRDIDH